MKMPNSPDEELDTSEKNSNQPTKESHHCKSGT